MAKTPQQNGKGKWLAGVALVALLGAGGWWFFKGGTHDVAPAAGPGGKGGLPVEVAEAVNEPLAETLQVAGQVLANTGVELRSEVTGRVVAVKAKDGTFVKKGEPVVVLDDSVQRATLAQAEANFALAETNVGRYQRLVEVGAASQLQLDQMIAQVKLEKANIQMAKANLAKFRIAAPFDGNAGIAQVNVGDLVQPGQLLVALTDNRTLKVTFKVPEAQATSLQVGEQVSVRGSGAPGEDATVVEGTIAALDGRVDPNSRTLEGKILIDNTSGTLVTGQFVRVRVPVRSVSDAVVIPDQALVPQGTNVFVYVIVPGKDGAPTMASRTTVDVGLRTANRAQVLRGVEAGQQVVTAGQQKLQAPLMPVATRSPTVVTVAPQAVEDLR